MNNYMVYFKKHDGGYRCLGKDGKYHDKDSFRGDKKCSMFEMLGKTYEASDEGLKEYNKEFKQWHYQLLKINKDYETQMKYSKFYDHRGHCCKIDITKFQSGVCRT